MSAENQKSQASKQKTDQKLRFAEIKSSEHHCSSIELDNHCLGYIWEDSQCAMEIDASSRNLIKARTSKSFHVARNFLVPAIEAPLLKSISSGTTTFSSNILRRANTGTLAKRSVYLLLRGHKSSSTNVYRFRITPVRP
jgi:hypothetical protein